jgi:hypothetical protein
MDDGLDVTGGAGVVTASDVGLGRERGAGSRATRSSRTMDRTAESSLGESLVNLGDRAKEDG